MRFDILKSRDNQIVLVDCFLEGGKLWVGLIYLGQFIKTQRVKVSLNDQGVIVSLPPEAINQPHPIPGTNVTFDAELLCQDDCLSESKKII